MISFPNAKINIGLQVGEKRTDGYHQIETIFYPVAIHDVLEIKQSNQTEDIQFTNAGLTIEGENKNNICVQAFQLLKKEFPSLPSVECYLLKTIPMGAGMGGGSADGTSMLQMLNKLFDLKISKNDLIKYALTLGSDCPFFLENKPCYATGRGEDMEFISLDLSHYAILLVYPNIHISTSTAFNQLKKNKHSIDLKKITSYSIYDWKDIIVNDFETMVFQQFSEIKNIKNQLYTAGAIFASMSGTGSTVYGIFNKNNLPAIKFPSSHFCKWV